MSPEFEELTCERPDDRRAFASRRQRRSWPWPAMSRRPSRMQRPALRSGAGVDEAPMLAIKPGGSDPTGFGAGSRRLDPSARRGRPGEYPEQVADRPLLDEGMA